MVGTYFLEHKSGLKFYAVIVGAVRLCRSLSLPHTFFLSLCLSLRVVQTVAHSVGSML